MADKPKHTYADVVRKALEDKDFQALARKDPRSAMRQLGIEPTDEQVRLAKEFPWHHADALHKSFGGSAKADFT